MKLGVVFFLLLVTFVTFSVDYKVTIAELPDGGTNYYKELIEEALKLDGHTVTYTFLKDLPQTRITEYLENGTLTLHWYVGTKERDEKYVPVNVGITNGLIGHRILFIPKGNQAIYNNVKTLDDFKKLNLVGGFGKGWFDVKVWEANGLKYYEKEGDFRDLYAMVASGKRGVDYFSRGAHEIVVEAKTRPELDIEKNLVFIYERDFKIYLSKNNADKKDVLEKALTKAKTTGLMDRLIRKHFSEVFSKDGLNLDKRIKIKLVTPQ